MTVRTGRRAALGLALAGAAWAGSRPARAQSGWPDRPVRLVVPFGAGGAIDTLSRALAQGFAAHANGQALVIDNRAGAGGTIAGAHVAQARPDGSTLMMADLGANAIAHEMMRGLPYDPRTAFAPVCHVATLPLVLLVPASSPATDVAGLLALARRQPDLPYAHPGVGYVGHLAQELMLREAGVTMTPVPYRSGAEVVRSLLAAETGSSIITVSTSLPFVREGRLRALAVLGPAPIAVLPGVPSLSATLPAVTASVWHGVVAPAALSAETVAAANRAINAAIAGPELRRVVTEVQAGEVVGGTAAAFGALIAAETARWTPLIRALGLQTG